MKPWWPSESTLEATERLYFRWFYQLEAVFGRKRAGEIIVRTVLR